MNNKEPLRMRRTNLAAVVSCVTILMGAGSVAYGQFSRTVTFASGYVVDGQLKKPLILIRGYTYAFNLVDIASFHPFKFTTSATGGGGTPVYTNGVTGTPASGTTTVTFQVTQDAPDVLYYQCNVHANLGARIDIEDPPSILELSLSGPDLLLSVTNLLGTQTSVLVADDLVGPVWTTGAVFTASGPATNVTMSAGGLGPRHFLRLGAVHP